MNESVYVWNEERNDKIPFVLTEHSLEGIYPTPCDTHHCKQDTAETHRQRVPVEEERREKGCDYADWIGYKYVHRTLYHPQAYDIGGQVEDIGVTDRVKKVLCYSRLGVIAVLRQEEVRKGKYRGYRYSHSGDFIFSMNPGLAAFTYFFTSERASIISCLLSTVTGSFDVREIVKYS